MLVLVAIVHHRLLLDGFFGNRLRDVNRSGLGLRGVRDAIGSGSVVSAAISSEFSALRASPSQAVARKSSASSSTLLPFAQTALLVSKPAFQQFLDVVGVSGLSSKICERETSGELT